MAEQPDAVGGSESFKKSWGFGAGSVSAELQAAAQQIISDSRLPGSDLNTLLNAFFGRYLVGPFQATPGRAYDLAGVESAEFGSLIYTSSQPLERVPTDALACAVDTHQTLTLENLRASYAKIAAAKALTKSPVPKTSADTPIADATMGIIFAVDSSEPLERLAEELQELNKQHPHNHWVDMIVILSRGSINYACQFPHKGLGDFLPPARGGTMRAPMYVHIVARGHAGFCLNRMCATLFYYLYLFSPGTALPPYKEILDGVPNICMTIAPYQMNLRGELVPVPLELRFNQFFLFPVGFRVFDNKKTELARVSYLPWQDGGVVRMTGKLPIEAALVFAGKEAMSEPVIRLDGDQFSGVIPLSRQQFVDMANLMAQRSRNMYLKPDPRPNWVVEQRANEGTTSPFMARLFLGICHLRDHSLSDEQLRAKFDAGFEQVLTGVEEMRTAAAELVRTFSEYQQQVSRGEAVRFVNGMTFVDKNVDRQIRKLCEDVVGTGVRVVKSRLQDLLKNALGLQIGFLFQDAGAFNKGLTKMKQQDAALAEYIEQARAKWSERVVLLRNNFEHAVSAQLKVKLLRTGTSFVASEPQVEGQPVSQFVNDIVDRVCCFVEDVLAHVLQSRFPAGMSITEIPLTERNPEIVERFRPMLIGGGSTVWTIAYHDSKFEEH